MRVLALVLLLLAPPSFARSFAGMNIPETLQSQGQTLQLNGIGLRKKLWFKAYVIGLYLPQATHDAQAIIHGQGVREVRLKMLRDVDRETMTDAIREGFEKNSKDQMSALNLRLLQFSYALPDLKEGDELVFTFVPGKGTVLGGVARKMTIPGDDFSQALLSVWLGPEPVDGGLKQALLGGR